MVILIKKAFLFPLFAVASGQMTISAQQDVLTGRVVNAETQEKITFAHIENYSRHITTFTDTSGLFTLAAGEGDTLVFSAIGYFYKKFIVTDSVLRSQSVNIFELSERIYELSEANIYIPGTYKEFKQDYLNLKLPETQTDILRKDLTSIAANEGRKAYEEALARGEIKPPKFGFPIYSADEKARFKLKKVLSQEEKQKLVHEKYNVEIVKRVTGLEDEDEILSFMLFCNFDTEYLLEVNPLDLMEQILEKYEEFQKKESG